MRLALLTCSTLPDWEQDDRFLHDLLTQKGIQWSLIPWDAAEDWSKYDVVLIRTTWDYVERVKDFEASLRQIAVQSRLLNPFEVVQWNLRKTYLQVLSERGIPIAPTVWIDGCVDLSAIMSEKQWTRGFLKPVVGASASDTKRFGVQDIPEVQRWLDVRVQEGTQFICQPYIDSVETQGEISTIIFGDTLSHSVQKIPVPGDYRVQDDYGASDFVLDIEAYPQVAEISNRVMEILSELFEDLLVVRLDFLLIDGVTPVINEVELIEPSLFFRHAPMRGPEILLQQLCSLIQS